MITLGDAVHFDVVTRGDSGVVDADSPPTFSVFEEANDTPIVSGEGMTKRTGLTGQYRGLFLATTAAGFEAGKWYNVIATGTVAGVTDKTVVLTFVVREQDIDTLADALTGAELSLQAAFDGGTLTIFKGAEYSSANGNTQTFSFPSLPDLTSGEVRIHIFREYGVPIIDYAQTVNNPATTKDVVFALPSTETDKLDAPAPYIGQFVYKASGATGYMPANEFQVKTRRM